METIECLSFGEAMSIFRADEPGGWVQALFLAAMLNSRWGLILGVVVVVPIYL